MTRFFIILIMSVMSAAVCAQSTAPAVKGSVVDASTGKPVEYAGVTLSDTNNNTIASAEVEDGRLEIHTAREGRFIVTIMLLGYRTYRSDTLDIRRDRTADLGTIRMEMEESSLDEVVVTRDRSKVVYRLDRRRIDASSVLSASGGTAADVLKSTPSVRVDADGNVSFRGSTGFLVYVNGKPSMLEGTQALEQIAAADIDAIEIMTTPSARYKTEGDVGIINITTRRHADNGVSGAAHLSGSTIGTWNTDATIGWRGGASRWYVGMAASDIRGKSDFRQKKTTVVDDFTTTSDADGTRHSDKISYIGRAGWEYDSGAHHLQAELQGGMTDNRRGGDMGYYEHRVKGDEVMNDGLYDSHDRYSNEKRLAQLSADYVLNLNGRGDRISVSGRLRHDWYALEYTESNMFDGSGARYEGTRGYEKEHHWDFDGVASLLVNYRPSGRIEAGYQYTSYSEHGEYNIKYWDRKMKDFVWQDNLHAPFFYRRQIHSLYAMLTDRMGKVEFDAGLRADHTIDELTISVAGADRYIRRLELFPSAHVSYDAGRGNVFTLGYSYRTNRPGIWQLEPYITYEDYYTKQIGNPDIRPEYIHTVEVGYRKSFAQENSVSLTAFCRSRRGVMDKVRVPYEPGVTLDSLINAGNDITFGLELNSHLRLLRCWDMTLNGSLFRYEFTSRYEGCADAANTSYSLSMMNNFSLGRSTRMQFDANFVGPTVLTQGREKAYCYFDLAVRRQLMRDRLAVSLVAHDVFRTARYDNRRSTATLMSSTYVRPKYPNIMLSVSYFFNASGGKTQGGKVSSGAMFEGKDF